MNEFERKEDAYKEMTSAIGFIYSKIDSVQKLWKKLFKEKDLCLEVEMFCDIHGHSRQNGVFIYGCKG